jgi:8-oxo-dGTP pyrophosphatase MutT (NUDIX family)
MVEKNKGLIPTNYQLEYNVARETFGNLRFERETALVACRTTDGDILVGAKPAEYPDQIYRFVGGGINTFETPAEGALRELDEELHLQLRPEDLVELAMFDVKGTAPCGTYRMKVHLFYIVIDKNAVKPGSDVEELIYLKDNEFDELVNRFKAIPKDSIYSDGSWRHSWYDFGQVYGEIHDLSHHEMLMRKL